MTSPANMKRAVLGSIREMRSSRESALNEYVDSLIAVAVAEMELANARNRRESNRTMAKDAGNTLAELDEAARIVKEQFAQQQVPEDGTVADIQEGQPW